MKKIHKIEVRHPRFNDEFLGYKDIERFFFDVLKKKKLSNAYIFNGIKGVGKTTFAYKLSRCILNNKNDNFELIDDLHISKDEIIFKKVANLTHPDLKVVEPDLETKKINLDKLKILDKFAYNTSFESNYKVIIIDSLNDFTTKKSFSSLLKLLEDCPNNCIFFLISHSFSNIPKTIISRCQKIYFKPISESILKKWFENSNLVEKDNLEILLHLSNGSLGRALKIINNNEYFNIYKKTKKIVKNIEKNSPDEINELFSMYDKNILLEDFLLIIQLNIIKCIKELILKKNKINTLMLDVYILLFFELNKKINNFKLYNLDSLQTLNTIKYIFTKHSKKLIKL